ncbi:MAG TPA: ferritin family protein [Phenylobacterium sp.]|jgi:ferritin-like protein|uniref:ferritin family protein n=1 Tax=Phenylobacterium sp. TaxID=1871053 RepID=UPI002C5A253B|nr:ferritin family protein [Phenylobacterium sp.]HXA38895.1 ferritin family protein [Phenylobacterium sp.]
MSSEVLHVPREKLRRETLNLHYAIASLMEEFDAVDWYRQRADDCDDPSLKAILLHNAHEELEHAAMVLEWIRRNDPEVNEQLKEYLFTEGSITGREDNASERHGL